MTFAFIMYLLGIQVKYKEGMVIKKNSFQAFIFAIRPNTLTAAIAPVLVGATLAALYQSVLGQHFSWIPYLLCLFFAVGMQIASNLINDYYDFKRGGDDKEERLGPPRACSMGWVDTNVMRRWIILIVFLSLCCGFPLVFYGGWNMVWIGVLCVLFAFLYTIFFASKGLGDLLVILFFGIVPVNFSFYLQTHCFSLSIFLISLGLGFIVDTLLILNNFRDVDQDAKSNKKTIAVLFGRNVMPILYLLCGLIGFASSFILFNDGYWIPVAFASPYLILHVIATYKMKKIAKGKMLNKILGSTSTNIFIFGFLLSAGALLQKYLLQC